MPMNSHFWRAPLTYLPFQIRMNKNTAIAAKGHCGGHPRGKDPEARGGGGIGSLLMNIDGCV